MMFTCWPTRKRFVPSQSRNSISLPECPVLLWSRYVGTDIEHVLGMENYFYFAALILDLDIVQGMVNWV